MKPTPVIVILFFLTALASSAQESGPSRWEVVGPGGGGTTLAPTISPHDSKVVVEHCDMTGAYITHDSGLSWRMFNLRGGNQTFAFDPLNPQVLYAGNAALWRSNDSGQTWRMVFPSPDRKTVEHQNGDHSDYTLTSDDPAYPGGNISAIAIASAAAGQTVQGGKEYLYLSFQPKRRPGNASAPATIIVSSTDGGASWSRFAGLPQQVLLLAHQNSGLIAISGSAAYLITPDGIITELGSIPTTFKAASVARYGDSVWIYATGRDGQVYLSEDSGLHWKLVTPALQQTAGKFEAIATSEHHRNVAYAGFRGLQLAGGKENLFNGIVKTTDGGQTWRIVFKESTQAASNLRESWIEHRATQDGTSIWFSIAYGLGVSPTNSEIVYASDLFRTYRTLNGGATWQQVNSKRVGSDGWTSRGLDVTTSYGMQFDPFDSRHIYMDNTDIGLFESPDGGRSWRSSTEGIPENWRNTTYWLAFDPTQRGLLWGAFSDRHDLPRPKMWRNNSPRNFTGGVAVSNDGGHHWQPSSTGIPEDSITHILLDPSSPVGNRTLYACAFGRGVYKSTDNGRNWTQKNNGIAGDEPFAWRITPSQDGSLYLVVSRRSEGNDDSVSGAGDLYRSTDRAEHWQPVALPSGVTGPTGLEVDPRDPRRLYLTAWGQEHEDIDVNGGVYASDDGGKTWQALFTQSQHVYDVAIDLHHPDTLYITGFDAAAFRSTDRGVHWTPINGYDFKWGHRIILDPNDPTLIYITTFGGGVWHGPAAGTRTQHETILNPIPIAQ
jgi:photosystem II stability/assembly factor-like uncharacterized protein